MKLLLIVILMCCTTIVHADWKKESFDNSSAWIYSPKNLNNNTSIKNALMVNLHGCAQKPEDLKADGNWTTTADDYNMVVALPLVPNGGKYSGCWDYYGADHTRTNRDNVFLLNLVKNLLSRTELNLDANQVYVSGLSSGGGESMVLGCLAPDVFSGMGLNAGPSTGTTANDIGKGPTSLDLPLKTCLALAANSKVQDSFKTQLTSIIYGNNDFIVNPKHDTSNAEVMSNVYNAKTKSTFDTKKLPGTNNDGIGSMWSDEIGPRISMIMNTNLGHNWPAGQGGNGGNFINKKSINYPLYITKYFFENNRRAKKVSHPEVLMGNIEVNDNHFWINGNLDINKELIKSLEAVIFEKINQKEVARLSINLNQDQTFEGMSPALGKGEYDIKLNLEMTSGKVKSFFRNAWIGEIPNVLAPQLFNVNFMAQDDCVLIRGQAVNNGPDKVTGVEFNLNGKLIGHTIVENTSWGFRSCGIEKGEHELVAFAVNENGIQSNQAVYKFTIGLDQVTSTLFDHMSAHRLHWEDYGVWYAKYQSKPFTLYRNTNGLWNDSKSLKHKK
jgi:poly(3-hydroxybutyrate) depolymerase